MWRTANTPGEILLRTKSGGNCVSYIGQMATEPAGEETWKTIRTTISGKISVNGLTSGKRYYFRVALVTKKGQDAWSNVLTIIVQ